MASPPPVAPDVEDPSPARRPASFQLVGVMDEDPFDPRTWSGISVYFFAALRRRGVLHDAVSAEPFAAIRRLYQLASFQPDLARWRFKYHLNVGYYRQRSRVARRKLARIDDAAYQAILQVGAWYDTCGHRGKPVVSYHDGNLATLLASPYGHPRLHPRTIERTLAYERDLYRRIDLILPMSRWLADSFVSDNGVAPAKVHPVGAGINLPRVRDVRGKSYDAPRLLFVGRDFERKGGADLLAAFARVRRELPDAELTIVGPPLAAPGPGVRCVGYLSKADDQGLERLLDEYARASVFVMPSLYEPFGIVFAEAMAHRLPCVGTDLCAMPEIIDAGRTGYVVPPRDPEALARRLVELLRDPAACRALGDAGHAKYEAQFTWDAVAERIAEIVGARLAKG